MLLCCILLSACGSAAAATDSAAKANPANGGAAAAPKATTTITREGVKQLIFGEQKIEGKIRRPQLVLIKADQRPDFSPMVMQSMGKTKNIAALVDQSLVEDASYKDAFRFEGTTIVNIQP